MTDTQKALVALSRIDRTLLFIRNGLNEPDELVLLNLPSIKADLDGMIRDLRMHGATLRAALEAKAVDAGTYVLATKYDDGDPFDQWCVGIYDRFENERHYVVDSNGKQFRLNGFRRCEEISEQFGDFLIKNNERISPYISSQKVIGSLWESETTIRAALEAKAVDVPDHTEMLREAVEMLRIAKKIANDESIRLSDGKTHEYYQINKIWHLIDGSETKINTALGK